ncbi:hypothetical protein ATS72_006290 [Pseudoalteromonas sp. 13-15]|jgi:hypothetical protein|uniref:DUF6491 family protein n=2 Tax=Pseudoalteromonas TaxID=53246 RepID=A0ABT9FDZ1_9GAMM|nr:MULTISPECIES: DUF6491 family protein [Pseudoalteromonas]AUL73221.1 hypothetical protein ATS72_006290 [Pseudoalteromonas sp. 13-15]KAF7778012.1 hypothetical protein PMAN_a2796 [Pseudoalteromonas marina]KTF09659.1 hypothetical protein ATS76_10445 [Pseudoalteromonas sp. 10-33]MBW4966566.1 hypothetical protein [Pseudoalteromonas sp. CR1]MDP2565015.1 DUF6491 family protein [Pseudoalteromonas marina]|tara:strand:+ start:1275 stop:1703 length:429 start_codon:yes stop_codon:yes gene_type:complete
MKNILVITLAATVLLGCSATSNISLKEKDQAYAKYLSEENLAGEDKINSFRFKGWKPLSDKFLIISAAHKKDYLIETQGTCHDLNESHGIELNRFSNFVIHKEGDSISTIEQPTKKCFIKSIYPLTAGQTEHLESIGNPIQS